PRGRRRRPVRPRALLDAAGGSRTRFQLSALRSARHADERRRGERVGCGEPSLGGGPPPAPPGLRRGAPCTADRAGDRSGQRRPPEGRAKAGPGEKARSAEEADTWPEADRRLAQRGWEWTGKRSEAPVRPTPTQGNDRLHGGYRRDRDRHGPRPRRAPGAPRA